MLKRFRFSNVHIFFLKPSLYSSKYLWRYGKGLICLNLFNHFDEPKGVSRRLQVKGMVWGLGHPSILSAGEILVKAQLSCCS